MHPIRLHLTIDHPSFNKAIISETFYTKVTREEMEIPDGLFYQGVTILGREDLKNRDTTSPIRHVAFDDSYRFSCAMPAYLLAYSRLLCSFAPEY